MSETHSMDVSRLKASGLSERFVIRAPCYIDKTTRTEQHIRAPASVVSASAFESARQPGPNWALTVQGRTALRRRRDVGQKQLEFPSRGAQQVSPNLIKSAELPINLTPNRLATLLRTALEQFCYR